MNYPAASFRHVVFLVVVLLFSLQGRAQERRPEGERGREGGGMRMNPLFAALDANGDGVIDAQELANAPAALQKLDRNGDGKITEDEARPAFGGRGGPGQGAVNVDEIVARMLQMDKDGDGKLSKEELPERMAGMMERGDANKDGFLTRDELVQLARAQAQRGGPGGERGRDRSRGGEERR
jgi:Ca2+-binding EF-hand superfamily protein